MGFSDFSPKSNIPIDANFLGQSNLTQIGYSIGDASAVEAQTAVTEGENQIYKHFYHEENSFDERSTDSEELAQQLIERALMLCHMSQDYWQRGELERAIELLDQAYLLLLGINTCESESLMQQKEDLRFTISKRVTEIYASRKVVVDESHSEIPVNINKQVQYEIDLYTTGKLRNHFIDSYKKSGKYRAMIVDMLKEEGLPQELSWLPLVESGFRVRALSNARALGLWQFIPSTGYRFGLSRNRYIDERLNPEKSTRAAIDYLKELHSHFGDWSTALAAYNCGETRVLRAIKNQKINYLDNFWDLYEHLPGETARYVPKFHAILHIVKNLDKYDLDNIAIDSPIQFESLTVTEEIHLEDAAEITGIDIEILEELNPELRRNIIPGGKYQLNIPKGSKQRLWASVDQIIRLNPASIDFIKHRVQSGETLSLIARRYRTSVANIMLANNMNRANHIITGEMLKIPQ
jgi:membrane-bound lytic murein transglycosylase D